MSYTATYSPEDNKIRLYASEKLPPDLYARVKAAGFIWAPKQGLFVAPMWTPAREDLAVELAGELEDEDKSLVERAEERAERFEDYSERRAEDSERAHAAVETIAGCIPLGQPILVGHHSERRARKDAERIENGMRKAVKMWQQSKYWEDRAQGAIRHAKYKERPDVRARRIKKIEADLRRQEKFQKEAQTKLKLWDRPLTIEQARQVSNFADVYVIQPCQEHPGGWSAYHVLLPEEERYKTCPAGWTVEQVQNIARAHYPRLIAECQRWVDHYTNRLIYERAMLAEAGGTATDKTGPEVGGAIRCLWSPGGYGAKGWSYIQKVNKVSISIHCLSNYGPRGETEESKRRIYRHNTPLDKVWEVMTAAQVQAHRDAGTLTEAEGGTGFFLSDAATVAEVVNRTEALTAERQQHEAEAAKLEALKAGIKAGVQVVAVPDLFATPPELARQVVELAELEPGHRVLEPSAGTGNLLGAMGGAMFGHNPERGEVVGVEVNGNLLEHLRREFPLTDFRQADFLTCNGDLGKFDRIVMNPPFSGGADIKHIQHARTFLKPGGKLVAICANGPRQQAQLQPEADAWIDLPAGSFKDAGTNVNAAICIFTAPAVAEPTPEPIRYELLTREQAGALASDEALGMVGPWWSGGEGTERLNSEEGRQQLHRSWLRNTYNNNAEDIPLEVLKSHAMDPPDYAAHCWFARELYRRLQPTPQPTPTAGPMVQASLF